MAEFVQPSPPRADSRTQLSICMSTLELANWPEMWRQCSMKPLFPMHWRLQTSQWTNNPSRPASDHLEPKMHPACVKKRHSEEKRWDDARTAEGKNPFTHPENDANQRPWSSTELSNRFERLVDIKLASRDYQTEQNHLACKSLKHFEASICSLKLLNLSLLSSGSRKAWRDELHKKPRKWTTLGAIHRDFAIAIKQPASISR